MEKPLGAQISHMLKDRGVDVIFGIPGVHNQEMYRGIEEAGITHVLARHEQGAGFMADGYARATGKVGVAYVITGPGLCNIMTPMGQAYSDSVPMLVISSCLDEVAAKRGQLHQMKDQRGAAETVCDWSQEARSADAAYALVDRALVEFETKRPRSKHIQVPISLLETPAAAAPQAPSADAVRPSFDTGAEAQHIRNLLAKADRPLVIFGGGMVGDPNSTQISKWIKRFLRSTQAASFVTYAGRGLVDPQDPLHFGAGLSRTGSQEVIASSDLVIAFGTELAEVDLWRSQLGHSAHFVRIDCDPQVVQDSHRASEGFVADAPALLRSLANPKHIKPMTSTWVAQDVAATRARWRADIEVERPGIVPVCVALRDAVPPDTMIYSDMTQLAYTAKEVWDMDRPGHWHHPTGFGTLGYATPAAIGGAVARPDKPTMAIIGDYGFHYTMAELGVAVELQLPLPIILWDNGKLKEIEDSMVRAQIAPNAVIAKNPDFCKLAEAFGAYSAAPKTLSQMQDAVQQAFKADGPTLIYVTPEITG